MPGDNLPGQRETQPEPAAVAVSTAGKTGEQPFGVRRIEPGAVVTDDDGGQGYHFARPMPAADLTAWQLARAAETPLDQRA